MLLVYCILPTPARGALSFTLAGVEGQAVVLINEQGLSAAVSLLAGPAPPTGLEAILVYKDVIERLHGHHTVIPLRYGSLCREDNEIRRLLRERRGRYQAILQELADCVEMSLRLLIPAGREEPAKAGSQAAGAPAAPAGRGASGAEYLQTRRVHYAGDEEAARRIQQVFTEYKQALAGLFVRCREEYPQPADGRNGLHIPLPALHFLVPRQALDDFQATLQNIRPTMAVQRLISGPWPPFNFVTPSRAAEEQDLPAP